MQRGFTIWLTGLPCAGKSTLAEHLGSRLAAAGRAVEILDGDVVRTHLSAGLGFGREHRDMNVRRIGFVAHLLSRNGVVVVVAAVSPYAATRAQVRAQVGEFVEVHVDCSLAECERRDVKGMYAKARAGEIFAFTGVDDPYEPPGNAEVTVRTGEQSEDESTEKILKEVTRLGYLEANLSSRKVS